MPPLGYDRVQQEQAHAKVTGGRDRKTFSLATGHHNKVKVPHENDVFSNSG